MSAIQYLMACARYLVGFVLLLGAATALNIGIVLGWNYLNPQSFGRSMATAVNVIDSGGGDALWTVAGQEKL